MLLSDNLIPLQTLFAKVTHLGFLENKRLNKINVTVLLRTQINAKMMNDKRFTILCFGVPATYVLVEK